MWEAGRRGIRPCLRNHTKGSPAAVLGPVPPVDTSPPPPVITTFSVPEWNSCLSPGEIIWRKGWPDSWLPQARFGLSKEEKPQGCKGRCQQERQTCQKDTHGERSRWPEGECAHLSQVCSCRGPRGFMCLGQGPLGALAAGLSGA